MYDIKQSTAITITFFVHDASGDAVTGLTNASFTKRISKGSGAFAAMTVTITEMENGWYSFPLTTTHSNTLGLLTILFTNAGAKQVNLQWRVQAKLTDDLNDFDAANDDVAVVTTNSDMRGTDGVDTATMRGTDGANTATPLTAAGTRTALGLATANMDTQFTASATATGFNTVVPPSVAQFNARTIASANYALEASLYDPTAQLTEAYAADGVVPTSAELQFMTWSLLNNRNVTGTVLSAYKIDDVTVSMTFTLDDGTNPTDQRRLT
jgi:hypothetical protein